MLFVRSACLLLGAAVALGEGNGEGLEHSKAAIDENGIIILNEEAFDEEVGRFKAILVFFHAPWCKKCDEVDKELTAAAKRFKELSIENAVFAKLDGALHGTLLERFYIRTLPVVKIFRDGKAYDYEKNKTADAFLETLKEYASSSWQAPPDNTVSLTLDTFDSFVKSQDATMVEFYAPWCQHCKQLAPEYEKAAVALKQHRPKIQLAKVDCIAEQALAQQQQISSYPTLHFYRHGKKLDYVGGRSAGAIIEYIKSRVGPPSVELSPDRKVISKYVLSKKHDPAIVGFFPNEEHEGYELYDILSEDLRDNFTFGHSFSSEVGRSFGIKGEYGIALFHPKHLQSKYEPKVFLLSEFDVDDKVAVREWLQKVARPLVGYCNENNSASLYDWKTQQPIVFTYYDVDFDKEMSATQYWRTRLLEVAKNFKDKDISFAVIDESVAESQLQNMGFTDSTADVFVAILAPSGKYPLHDDFSEDAVTEHVEAFLNGELKPYLRSETPPKPNKGPVKIVVGHTFDELVRDVDKDVLVEFYAPWCQHCQMMDPVLKKVGKHYSKNKDIVIAKYNCMANDVPTDFDVTGFPTIYFKKKGEKIATKYTADRGYKDILEFLDKNAASLQTSSDGKDEL